LGGIILRGGVKRPKRRKRVQDQAKSRKKEKYVPKQTPVFSARPRKNRESGNRREEAHPRGDGETGDNNSSGQRREKRWGNALSRDNPAAQEYQRPLVRRGGRRTEANADCRQRFILTEESGTGRRFVEMKSRRKSEEEG